MPPFPKLDKETAVATTKSKAKPADDTKKEIVTGADDTNKQQGTPEGAQGAQGDSGAGGTPTPPNDDAAAAAAAAQALADAQAQADAEAAAAEAEAAAAAQAKADEEAAAKAALEAEADAAAKAAAVTFPREMRVVNNTARAWVVRKHVEPSSSVVITVRDADDLHNLRQNCRGVLSISDHYKPVEGEPHALRIEELDEQA